MTGRIRFKYTACSVNFGPIYLRQQCIGSVNLQTVDQTGRVGSEKVGPVDSSDPALPHPPVGDREASGAPAGDWQRIGPSLANPRSALTGILERK